MIDFTIQIAGTAAAVSAMFESTRFFCQEYLSQAEPDFSVRVCGADIEYERQKSAREDALEGLPPREYSDAYLETIAVQRKIVQHLFEYDTLLFHGSVVAMDGSAYLFTAKSGTGKSTHTRLWRQVYGSRAVMVNDDKPFLRLTSSEVLAYGSPWNGKHRLSTNTCVPLKAICILERGSENRIRPIPAKEALLILLQQSSRPAEGAQMGKYLELIDMLSSRVAFYRLQCTMDPEAAIIAHDAMTPASF